MTTDPALSRKKLAERVRNTKFVLGLAAVSAVVWTVFWATGGTTIQGVLALLWIGLTIYAGLMLRRMQRDLRREYPDPS